MEPLLFSAEIRCFSASEALLRQFVYIQYCVQIYKVFFTRQSFYIKKSTLLYFHTALFVQKTQKLLYSSYERTILCKHQNAKQTLILKPAKYDYYLYKYQKKDGELENSPSKVNFVP
jgi:hypothetical protein